MLNMREIDARGLSCPEPLMLAHDAIAKNELPAKILVDESFQKTNIEKMAKTSGKKTTVKECGTHFEVVVE